MKTDKIQEQIEYFTDVQPLPVGLEQLEHVIHRDGPVDVIVTTNEIIKLQAMRGRYSTVLENAFIMVLHENAIHPLIVVSYTVIDGVYDILAFYRLREDTASYHAKLAPFVLNDSLDNYIGEVFKQYKLKNHPVLKKPDTELENLTKLNSYFTEIQELPEELNRLYKHISRLIGGDIILAREEAVIVPKLKGKYVTEDGTRIIILPEDGDNYPTTVALYTVADSTCAPIHVYRMYGGTSSIAIGVLTPFQMDAQLDAYLGSIFEILKVKEALIVE